MGDGVVRSGHAPRQSQASAEVVALVRGALANYGIPQPPVQTPTPAPAPADSRDRTASSGGTGRATPAVSLTQPAAPATTPAVNRAQPTAPVTMEPLAPGEDPMVLHHGRRDHLVAPPRRTPTSRRP